MSDLQPAVSDEPVDDGDRPTRRRRAWWRVVVALVVVVVITIGVTLALDTPAITTFFAVLLGALILRAGWFFLQTVATPPPPPPEPGTIRKVKLVYRCSVCGAEVRMTAAPTEDPEPPRHCFEDMDLVAPID
ncbi:MAG: hypothetical protein JST64_12560 [Actinobacteria bacterium]|nr:hypothetical protein [Actinomycetota bacterium]